MTIARYWLEYLGYRLLVLLAAMLPLALTRRAITAAARAVFAFGGKHVRYALVNLEIAFPERSEAERRALGRRSYENFALALLDLLRSGSWGRDDILGRIDIEGEEHLREALAAGGGAFALSLHVGNFDLAGRVLPLVDIPATTLMRPIKNPLIQRRLAWQRGNTGVELLEHTRAAPGMLRALRRGRLVVALIDQYSRRTRGVFVPLFGRRCSTSAGIATLAIRTGAPIIPCYTLRTAPDHHMIRFLPPIEFERSGDRSRDIEALTARFNEAYEAIIRAHPEQWLWAHRRFRHSPDLDADPYRYPMKGR